LKLHQIACLALAVSPWNCLNAAADPLDVRRPKKLIETGHDAVDPQRLEQFGPQIRQRPFDGLVLNLSVPKAKKNAPFGAMFKAVDWSRDWFEPSIAELKKGATPRLPDNFLSVHSTPGDVDWFDDDGWRQVVEHWRIAAWIVRQAGLKGMVFDPEAYDLPHAQFRYAAQPQRQRHRFEEYYAKARSRGREVMRAVAEQCPNAVLFCYFMNSVCAAATGQPDPRMVLREHAYGLYPPFIDGWLDAAPPTITLVDGCEMSYLFNSAGQFLQAGQVIRGDCQELVSPENRAKYRAQVQVSFGIYLDAYWNPPDSPWYIDGLGGARVARLGANVASALYVADEYVWIYGERFRWWPTPAEKVQPQSWPEVLPHCDDYLRCARDPLGYSRGYLARQKQRGQAKNLAVNGDFSDDAPGTAPAGWATWQAEKSQGSFGWDRTAGHSRAGSARAVAVTSGCFLQGHLVRPGERYIVRAMRKIRGQGETTLRIRWQTAAGHWIADTQDRVFYAAGPRDAWSELFGVVEVPAEAGKLLILLEVAGQQSADDAAWFDDVELYPLVFP
jgi:hypothetical protein